MKAEIYSAFLKTSEIIYFYISYYFYFETFQYIVPTGLLMIH